MTLEIPIWLLWLSGGVLTIIALYMLFAFGVFAYVGYQFLKNWRPPNW